MRGRKTKTFRRRTSNSPMRKSLRRKSLSRNSSKKHGYRLSGGKMEITKPRESALIKLEPGDRITAAETLPEDLVEQALIEEQRRRNIINRHRELEGLRQRLSVPVTNEDIDEMFRGYQIQPPAPPQPKPHPVEEDEEMYDYVDISGGKKYMRKYRK